jgi:membrane protein
MVSLIVTAGLAAFGKYAAPHIQEWLFHVISILISLSVISLLFAMMFKWLPDADVDWYDVWLGAILTAILFELGKSAIGFYIGKQGLESTYGAAASIIIVLIWVYYSSQIILMGAEVTHAYAKHHGSIKNREQAGPSSRVDIGLNSPVSS